MEAKSSAEMGHIRSFFTQCLPIAFTLKTMLAKMFTFLNVKFFSPNGLNNATESKISQN